MRLRLPVSEDDGEDIFGSSEEIKLTYGTCLDNGREGELFEQHEWALILITYSKLERAPRTNGVLCSKSLSYLPGTEIAVTLGSTTFSLFLPK